MRRKSFLLMLFTATIAWAMLVGSSQANTWTASGASPEVGRTISAKAVFEFGTHDFGSGAVDALKVTLSNTSPGNPGTKVAGELLTGMFWSMSSVGALGTGGADFDGKAPKVVTTSSGTVVNDVDIAPALQGTATEGAWQLKNNTGGITFGTQGGVDFNGFNYGIGTVGMGIFDGNDVGGTSDYGIYSVPANTGSPPLVNFLPLIENTAMYWFKKPTNLTSLNQITRVGFVYGSSVAAFQEGTDQGPGDPIPEPSSFALMGMASLGLWGYRRFRGKKTNEDDSAKTQVA